jgi:hypothetical protein
LNTHRIGTAKAVLNLIALITPEPSKDVLGGLVSDQFTMVRQSDPLGDIVTVTPDLSLVEFMVQGLRHYDARSMRRYDLSGVLATGVERVFSSTEMAMMEVAYTGNLLSPWLRSCFLTTYGGEEGDRQYTGFLDGLVNGFYTDQPCPFGRASSIMKSVLTNEGRFEPEVQWTLPFLPVSERPLTRSLTPTPTMNSLRQAA